MQKARRHSLSCSDRLQAYGFRVYFTPLFTVLFTFPSRYQFTIGLSGVFSLTRWSWQFQTGFHVPRPTQDTAITYLSYLYGTITLYGHTFPRCSNSINSKCRSPTTPALPKQYRFGLLPFRSPLLWESLLFSSPPPTQMFQFSGFAHLAMQYIFNVLGCPIRIFADQLVCANPRNFSQLITSFFASESLGIPHTPLHNLFVLVCSSFEFLVFSFKL